MKCKYGCEKEVIFKNRCNKWTSKCPVNIEKNRLGNVKVRKEHPEKYKGRIAWNKGLTKGTNKCVANYAKSISKTLTGKVRTQNTRLKISSTMKTLGTFGGYREGSGRTKKYYVLDSFGTRVCLQGSFEVLCSKILNKLKIKWVRPSCLWYSDNKKRYFPDFLLVDYNIYLDPKNDFLIKIDKEKIKQVLKENNVKLYILSKKQITKEYILSLIRP